MLKKQNNKKKTGHLRKATKIIMENKIIIIINDKIK